MTEEEKAISDGVEQRREFAAAILGANETLTEQMQAKVKEAYTLNSRFYHDWAHAGDVGQPMTEALYDALSSLGASTKQIYAAESHQTLAGFYHDVVYAPVDNIPTGNVGVTPKLRQQLDAYIDFGAKPFKVRDQVENTPATQVVFDMFGEKFKPGSALNPFGGQNELLSAIVMAQDLESIGVQVKDIARIAQRIAVTIPFDINGPVANVDNNLRAINERQNLGLTETELRVSFVGTIDLANRDVKGFGSEFSGYSIGTRNLLAEARPELRDPETYKPENLYTAVMGAAGFTGSVIKPDTIFHQVKLADRGFSYPSDEEIRRITDKAKNENIPSGVVYLEALAAAAALTRASLAAQDPSTANLAAAKLGDALAGVTISGKAREQMLNSLTSADQRNTKENVVNAIDSLRTDNPGFQPDKNLRETAAKLLEILGPDRVRIIAQEAKDPEVKFPAPVAMRNFGDPKILKEFLDAVEAKVIVPAKLEAHRPTPLNSDLATAIVGIEKAVKGEARQAGRNLDMESIESKLDTSGARLDTKEQVKQAAAEIIANSPNLKNLTKLDLGDNEMRGPSGGSDATKPQPPAKRRDQALGSSDGIDQNPIKPGRNKWER